MKSVAGVFMDCVASKALLLIIISEFGFWYLWITVARKYVQINNSAPISILLTWRNVRLSEKLNKLQCCDLTSLINRSDTNRNAGGFSSFVIVKCEGMTVKWNGSKMVSKTKRNQWFPGRMGTLNTDSNFFKMCIKLTAWMKRLQQNLQENDWQQGIKTSL